MERVSVFIDGSNFYFGLKRNNFQTRIDYFELSRAMAGPDRQLQRTYYFNSIYDANLFPEQFKQQQSFLDSLDRTPYLELILGKLVPFREGGFREKGVDTRMASEILYRAAVKSYETALVITDNPDFVPVISQVKDLGVSVELFLFRDAQPRELVSVADLVVEIEAVLAKKGSKIFPSKVVKTAGPVFAGRS